MPTVQNLKLQKIQGNGACDFFAQVCSTVQVVSPFPFH